MNPNRSYGVEVECLSRILHAEVARKLNEAFAIAGNGHTAQCRGYCQQTDGLNRTVWFVKSDGSIRTTTNYPFNVEIVTPVLYGEDGLAAIKVAFEALNDDLKVNTSCGLHVHHGADGLDIANLIIGYMRAERTLFECLPPSRRNNRYCAMYYRYPRPSRRAGRSIGRSLNAPPRQITNWRAWYQENISTRYVGLNLESIAVRNTVEVRCGSGSTEHKKICSWVRVTQRLVERASDAPERFSEGIDNLLAALADDTSSAANQAVSPFWEPSSRRSRHIFLHNLLKSGNAFSRADLIQALVIQFNMNESLSFEHLAHYLKYAKKGGVEFFNRRGVVQIVAGTAETSINSPAPVMLAAPAPVDLPEELRWLKRRWAKFNPEVRAAAVNE